MKSIITLLSVSIFSYAFSNQVFESGEKRNHLIELYTSQSCSSCPPAEAWLSNFKSSNNLWKRIIPISFHVTYWNDLNIGGTWEDTFSANSFTQRQRELSSKIGSGVYTPQAVHNGKDFRWRRQNINLSDEKVGELSVNLDYKKEIADIKFKGSTTDNLLCHFTLLKGTQKTKIKAGENRGLSLTEDFVVTKHYKEKMIKRNGSFSCNINISQKDMKQNKYIASWVANNRFKVIQATGGEIKLIN